MKKSSWPWALLALIGLTGCHTHSNVVWEDTKTIGRYLYKKGQLFWKQDSDSRMVSSQEEFFGPQEEDYIPLKDEDLKTQFIDQTTPQPKEIPGGIGSSIPSIDQFVKPSAHLEKLFQNFYFNTDEHTLKSKDSYQTIAKVAEYMKKHPNVYIFVSGHCDERASEAYNLSLGTRRANTIRTLLIKRGVQANQIYTISFGKEMPADPGHTPDAWAKNRRVEFKIFEKKDAL